MMRNAFSDLIEIMTFEHAREFAVQLHAKYTDTCNTIAAIPGVGSGPMGLTPDAVRNTPEYQNAKREVDMAFATLRQFNSVYTKKFKKEIAAERDANRGVAR